MLHILLYVNAATILSQYLYGKETLLLGIFMRVKQARVKTVHVDGIYLKKYTRSSARNILCKHMHKLRVHEKFLHVKTTK